MQKKLRLPLIVLLAVTAAAPAQAYVDPGSGMLIWQGLLAALGVVVLFLRNPWQRFKLLLARLKNRNAGP